MADGVDTLGLNTAFIVKRDSRINTFFFSYDVDCIQFKRLFGKEALQSDWITFKTGRRSQFVTAQYHAALHRQTATLTHSHGFESSAALCHGAKVVATFSKRPKLQVQ